MIRYVQTSGSDVATRLSGALWSLACPSSERAPEDTQEMFEIITCLDGTAWLAVVDDFAIQVHEQAELDGIADVLQPWINDGALPADTNTNLATFIEAKRGQQLVVWDAFPDLFKKQAMTREELVKLGLLVDLSPLPSA